MNTPRISVIVPVYNTKRELLDRCLRSILNQTLGDFELLIIDDGSKTDCADALDQWGNCDGRIFVHHQENGGVSVARNKGLELAKGEYIVFVDSDDEIMPAFLEVYLNYIEKYDLDMVLGGRNEIYPNAEKRSVCVSLFASDCYVLEASEALIEKLLTEKITGIPELPNDVCGPWAKMIKADLAKKVAFPVGIKLFEDLVYNLYLCKYVRKIGFIKENLYCYYILQASATRQEREDEMLLHETYLNLVRVYINEEFPQKINAYYGFALLRYAWVVRKQKDFRAGTCKKIADIPLFAEVFQKIDASQLTLMRQHRAVLWIARHQLWVFMSLLCGFDRLRYNVRRKMRGI